MHKRGLKNLFLIFGILAISASILLLNYHARKEGAQQLRITAEKTNIPISYSSTSFTALLASGSAKDLPYIKDREAISFKFYDNVPDTANLTEQILTERGTSKFATDKNKQTIAIQWRGNKGIFKVQPNYAAGLSGNSRDFAPGTTIKGYRLFCRWGQRKTTYFFVIRGDGAILNNRSD